MVVTGGRRAILYCTAMHLGRRTLDLTTTTGAALRPVTTSCDCSPRAHREHGDVHTQAAVTRTPEWATRAGCTVEYAHRERTGHPGRAASCGIVLGAPHGAIRVASAREQRVRSTLRPPSSDARHKRTRPADLQKERPTAPSVAAILPARSPRGRAVGARTTRRVQSTRSLCGLLSLYFIPGTSSGR